MFVLQKFPRNLLFENQWIIENERKKRIHKLCVIDGVSQRFRASVTWIDFSLKKSIAIILSRHNFGFRSKSVTFNKWSKLPSYVCGRKIQCDSMKTVNSRMCLPHTTTWWHNEVWQFRFKNTHLAHAYARALNLFISTFIFVTDFTFNHFWF